MIDPSTVNNRLSASSSRSESRRRRGAGVSAAASSTSPSSMGGLKDCPSGAEAIGEALLLLAAGLRRFRRAVVRGERPLALDEPARDIIGDGGRDRVDRLAFGDQHAAVTRVLKEAIGAPVVRHVDEGDHVEEKARMLALSQRQIEHVDARRGLSDDGFKRVLELAQTAELNFAQVRDRLGALGVFDSRLPDRGCEVRLGRSVLWFLVHRSGFRPRFRP